jgi:hypothetical protein
MMSADTFSIPCIVIMKDYSLILYTGAEIDCVNFVEQLTPAMQKLVVIFREI